MAELSPKSPGTGITGGLKGASLGIQTSIATLAAISWYNAIELVILVFVTFREYHGLYFWSLLVCGSIGLVPYSLGFMLKFFGFGPAWLSVTILTVGWYCMVTGQSVVLYSRLHLVLRNGRILRRIVIMICVDACLLHIPTTVLTYGSNLAQEYQDRYANGYNAMEKIQMTGFCIQEFIISGLYIWETAKLFRLDPDRIKRKIMYQLVIINLIIICMDLGLLIVEYIGLYYWETMIKGVVYGIKLKLEFAVLGKLIHLVSWQNWKEDSVIIHHHTRRNTRQQPSPDEFPDFVDATRVTSDLTHAPTYVTTTTTRTRTATIPGSVTTRRRSVPGMDSDDIDIAMFEHAGSIPSQEYARHDHDIEAHPEQKQYTLDVSRSPDSDPSTADSGVASKSWDGDRTTIPTTNHPATTTTCPVDFTDSLQRQRASAYLGHYGDRNRDRDRDPEDRDHPG